VTVSDDEQRPLRKLFRKPQRALSAREMS